MASKKDAGITACAYRKPPVEHQFKKGTSGNPKGRPKKSGFQSGGAALQGGVFDRVSAMALEEAMRNVTVREGDKVTEIPAIQAVLRAEYRAAAHGNTKAARQLLELLIRAEAKRVETAIEFLQAADRYQAEQSPIFDAHERIGLPPPEIYPHPDDFIFDPADGGITIDGPTSKEEAGARKLVLQLAIDSLPRFFQVEAALKKDPQNGDLKRELAHLAQFQEILKQDAGRKIRHEAKRQARQAAHPIPTEKKNPDDKGQS